MKKITVNLYKFKELSEEAQQEAINSLYDINVDYEWYDFIYDEAEELGFKIKGFDTGRAQKIDIEFMSSGKVIAENIIKNHGETTETYILAKNYLNDIKKLELEFSTFPEELNTWIEDENILWLEHFEDELEDSFHYNLGQEYLSILTKEYEYNISEEAIRESIEANDYDFTINGKLY
jgi:hypothetical protein